MKFGLIILSLILIASCSKQEPAASQDSLFTAPMQPAPPAQTYEDSTGLVIDSSVVRQQPDIERLKGIAPDRVVMIYRAFQPLRTHATTPAQREAFLHAQKITPEQLHSVLAEGDRLGWGKAFQRK